MTDDAAGPALFAGVAYDYVSVVAQGSLVFTAGACPLDGEGRLVAPADLLAQADQCVTNLTGALALVGAQLEQLVRTTIYVVGGPADLAAVWRVVAARLAPHRPPSTLLGVQALGYARQLVEIDGVAALPPGGDGATTSDAPTPEMPWPDPPP